MRLYTIDFTTILIKWGLYIASRIVGSFLGFLILLMHEKGMNITYLNFK